VDWHLLSDLQNASNITLLGMYCNSLVMILFGGWENYFCIVRAILRAFESLYLKTKVDKKGEIERFALVHPIPILPLVTVAYSSRRRSLTGQPRFN